MKRIKTKEGFAAPNTYMGLILTSLATYQYTTPIDLAMDSFGNIYSIVRSTVGTTGVIYKIATTGPNKGTPVQVGTVFPDPIAIAVDSSGNIFVSDYSLYTIFKITPDETKTIYAGGNGQAYTNWDTNTNRLQAKLTKPNNIVFDSSGNMYISDTSSAGCIRKIEANGNSISTYAKNLGTITNFRIDTAGNLYITDYGAGSIRMISTSGQISTIVTGLVYTLGLAIDSTNNLYVIDSAIGTRSLIKLSYPSYTKSTIISFSISNPAWIKINWSNPRNITLDSSGNLYVADGSGYKIWKITKVCPPGEYLNGDNCEMCDLGTWSAGGLDACTPCRLNTTTSSAGSITSNQCTTALPGYYMNGLNPIQCPLNATCDGGSNAKFICNKGTWANTTSCIDCPAYTTTVSRGSTASNQCSNIIPGYHMGGGIIQPCPSYATCPGGITDYFNKPPYICIDGYGSINRACEPCPAGLYGIGGKCSNCSTIPATDSTAIWTTLTTGQTSCTKAKSCKSNYYLNPVTVTCDSCPENATCTGGTASFKCVSGYRTNAAGTGCEECPIGFYGTNGTCTPCPSNRTTSSTKNTLVSQCIASIGYYMNGATLTACPSNTTTPSIGGTSSNNCTLIAQGYYMNGTTITQCPANTSCPGGSRTDTNINTFTCTDGYQRSGTICTACLAGSYGTGGTCSLCSSVAATDSTATWTTRIPAQTSCIADTCQPNFKLNALSNNCDPCPTGTSGPNCATTSAGYYIRNGVPLRCPSNATCVGGSESFVCADGFMKNTTGDACIECPEGSSGPNCATTSAGYYIRNGVPLRCPSNATCVGGSESFLCSNGFMKNTTGDACIECPEGSSGPNCATISGGYYIRNGVPLRCPSNATCVGGSESFLCADGFMKNTTGDACIECPEGKEGPNCTTISLGYYNNGTTTVRCPSNAICSDTSTTFVCSSGFIKNIAGNGCDPCPIGSSGTNCTTISEDYYLNDGIVSKCPSNARCSGGSDTASFTCFDGYEKNNLACSACARGSYGTGGTCSNCTNTPATDSTLTWTTNATGQTSCTIPATCKPNYKLNALSNNCDPCPNGTEGENCTTISGGYYISNGVPLTCPPNASCGGGSTPFVCSNNYIKNSNGDGCDPCPAGSSGLNCTTILGGYYNNGTTTLFCPSNATCAGGSASFVCADGYMKNERGDACIKCPDGTEGPNCTTISTGYYKNGSTVIKCPSNASCGGGSTPFVCADGYMMNESGDGCVKCPDGTSGLNCTTTLGGYYRSGSTVIKCPSNASCTGGSGPISFTCSNNFIKNSTGNGCEPCPEGTEGLNCTTILGGYYNNGTTTLFCPSNATCSGGAAPFVCAEGYMMNERGDGCVKCPDGTSGLNCKNTLPGFFMSGNRAVSCPSNANCAGGSASFTCSNGYYVNSRTNTCEEVTVIAQPGSSQLYNTRGSPSITDTTDCTATGCTLLFKDPITGNMTPRNPCVSQANYYNFTTKRCINKCCVLSMSNAKIDANCKYDVVSATPVKNTALCSAKPSPCCTNNSQANNPSCKNYWTRGPDSWTAKHNAACAAGFKDYNKLETMFEKREKWYQSRKILNSP